MNAEDIDGEGWANALPWPSQLAPRPPPVPDRVESVGFSLMNGYLAAGLPDDDS
jgi:hypothetical protein